MCVKLISQAYECDLDPAAKFLLVTLANMANPKNGNSCWPGVRYLTQLTGYTERTIQNKLKLLLAAGHVVRRFRGQKTPKYLVHPKPLAPRPTAQSTTPKGANDCIEPRKDCGETINETKKNQAQHAGQGDLGNQAKQKVEGEVPRLRRPTTIGKVANRIVEQAGQFPRTKTRTKT